jgi:hypothetical protein
VGIELARNFKHVAIAGAANSQKSEVLLAAIQQARITVQRGALGTMPSHEETAAVILVEDVEALDSVAVALRQRSSQPVLVLSPTRQPSSRVVPRIGCAYSSTTNNQRTAGG